MRTTFLALLLALIAGAQTRPEFEVASIKPAIDDGNHDSDSDRGYYKVHNLTLKRLIARAWLIDDSAISGGLNWVNTEGFDINARVTRDLAVTSDEPSPEMLQNLLADRFHLVIHREPRPVSGYELVVAKNGPKIEPARPEQNGSESDGDATHLTAKNVTMEFFVRRLSRMRDVGKFVVDKTGIPGRFNFTLEWTPAALEPAGGDVPPLLTAIQEQLGLKLESAKITIQAVVIDRAEKPSFDQ